MIRNIARTPMVLAIYVLLYVFVCNWMMYTGSGFAICMFVVMHLLMPMGVFLWFVARIIWRDLRDPKTKTLY